MGLQSCEFFFIELRVYTLIIERLREAGSEVVNQK